MARLTTIGYEVAVPVNNVISADNPTNSIKEAVGTLSRATTNQRTGAACLSCDSGAGNAAAYHGFGAPALAASKTAFARTYMKFSALPSTTAAIYGYLPPNAVGISVRLTSAGKLQLWNNTGTPAQIGSDSTISLSAGTYYRIELSEAFNASSQLTDVELRVDGATTLTASGLTMSGSVLIWAGWLTAPGANKIVYLDDCAINDSNGSVNNSWPGDGAVLLLQPTADSAVGTGWVRGNNTAISGGNGFQSVDNIPPVGIADLGGAGADTGQLRNATSAANANYDATMTTYTAAGVTSGSTVNAVVPWVCTAAPVVTSAKLGTVGVVSNPAITNVNLGAAGTAAAFWSGVAGSTYPTGWKWSPGTITETPSVTLGTAPVMRITQVTASTRIADVCFMGIYVDYTPSSGSTYTKAGYAKEGV